MCAPLLRLRFMRSICCSPMRIIQIGICVTVAMLSFGCSPVTHVKTPRVPSTPTIRVSGTWTVQDVAYGPWTLHLCAEGNTVTGTVKQERLHGLSERRMTSLTDPVEVY